MKSGVKPMIRSGNNSRYILPITNRHPIVGVAPNGSVVR